MSGSGGVAFASGPSPRVAAVATILTVCLLGWVGAEVHRLRGRRSLIGRMAGEPSLGGHLDPTERRVWRAPRPVVGALHDMGIAGRAEQLWLAWLWTITLVTLAALGCGRLGLAIAVVVACCAAPPVVAWALRDRRRGLIERQLPEFLDGLARSLRAGLSLPVAFTTVACDAPPALHDDLVPSITALASGRPFIDALHCWHNASHESRGVALTVAALEVVAGAGGQRARAVDGVAATLRERHATRREAHALATQARLSALVIVLAPAAFTAFIAAADRGVLDFLLGDPLGWACLSGGAVLDSVGAWWMSRLSRRFVIR